MLSADHIFITNVGIGLLTQISQRRTHQNFLQQLNLFLAVLELTSHTKLASLNKDSFAIKAQAHLLYSNLFPLPLTEINVNTRHIKKFLEYFWHW